TALGFIITYPELLYLAKQFSSNVEFGRPLLQSAFVIGGIYIVLCFILSGIAQLVERRLRSSPRGQGGATTDTGTVPVQPDDPRMHEGGTVTEVLSVQHKR
ncbi:MAG: amino acid ABC transporter permease, partial [Leucobacter sp.]|nr:amino acid ABC transporter permease [Leucobacter sp.]